MVVKTLGHVNKAVNLMSSRESLYTFIHSNHVAVGVQVVDILEGVDAEGYQTNPAATKLRQEEAEESTDEPGQWSSPVLNPRLNLHM